MKIEASLGEVVDKITILEIKLERMRDPGKLRHVRLEYESLRKSLEEDGAAVDPVDFGRLKEVNTRLWEVEDRIRSKHRDKEFDQEFIGLAKKVYLENDERFRIKAEINRKAGSKIVEEKEYSDYGGPDR